MVTVRKLWPQTYLGNKQKKQRKFLKEQGFNIKLIDLIEGGGINFVNTKLRRDTSWENKKLRGIVFTTSGDNIA